MSGTEVTARDIETGESESVTITDDFVVICDGKYRIAGVQRHSNGTAVVTLKSDAIAAATEGAT